MSNPNPTLQGCEILLVEDSLTQGLQLQYILSQHGHSVTLARNGQEALELLQFWKPTIIISDIVMPKMDGYDLCAAIKESAELRHLPVVLLTSLGNPEDIVRGLRANADCYLTKPYNVSYLVSTIETLLANPYEEDDDTAEELEVTVAGRSYAVKAKRRQMLNLLLSIYGGAVQRNQELEDTQVKLHDAMDRLARNQTQLETANRQLQAQVSQDGLTGVKNRRALDERLDSELARSARHMQDLSMLLVDIDHFKVLNDTYGHLEGDETLKLVANVMCDVARQEDFVARYGGEEFAVLLPETDEAGALAWAERLRQSIKQATSDSRPVTASIGISTWRGIGDPAIARAEFVDQADKALYQAKRTGRDRAVHFQSLE